MSKDQVITMFYELKDANSGEVLESNMTGGTEISFITGRSQVILKLEEELVKLKGGDRAEILIKSADALGDYDNSAVQSLPKEQFAGIELKEGMELFGQGEDGSNVRVIVKAIGKDEVMIDFNHPYAGKDLLFNVEVLEVREATDDEKATGVVAGSHSCGCGGGGHHHHHDDDGFSSGGHGHGGGCCGRHHH